MNLIKQNLDDLISKTNFVISDDSKTKDLNEAVSFLRLLDEREKEVMDILSVGLDSILYSKYYWCTKYKVLYSNLYGQDVGIEQQQYKVIEEIEQNLEEGVDWNIIQNIENELEI